MDTFPLVLTLASWGGCFWLGFQIGNARFERQRRQDLAELERRFKIVTSEAVKTGRQGQGDPHHGGGQGQKLEATV